MAKPDNPNGHYGPSEEPIEQAILSIESWMDDHPEALCIEDGFHVIEEREIKVARLSQLCDLTLLRSPTHCCYV